LIESRCAAGPRHVWICSAVDGDKGSNRVNRGGSWNNNARNVRAANRNNNDPGNRNNNLGLRPASSGRLRRYCRPARKSAPAGENPAPPVPCHCPDQWPSTRATPAGYPEVVDEHYPGRPGW